MNQAPSGGGVPELDPYMNSGVFLVGNDVVMDNVIVGSLLGEDEANSMNSQQQPDLSGHFSTFPFSQTRKICWLMRNCCKMTTETFSPIWTSLTRKTTPTTQSSRPKP